MGPDGLIDGKAPGNAAKLKAEQRAALAQTVERGPIPAVHGVVRWRLIDLVQRVWDEFGVSVSEATMSRELKALGYAKLSARPRHHAQNELVVAAPTSISISRSAAKPIISRNRSASGVFSISVFRFIVASLIGGLLESGCVHNPTLTDEPSMTTSKPLARYGARFARGCATVDLHHYRGHDQAVFKRYSLKTIEAINAALEKESAAAIWAKRK